MIINLSRNYPSIWHLPLFSISTVDTGIFTERYFTNCLNHPNCKGVCCQYGADVDLYNMEHFQVFAEILERFIGIPSEQWFSKGSLLSDEIQENMFKRTSIVKGACLFLNQKKGTCSIHSFSLVKEIDYHFLKPFVCSIFPLYINNGLLSPTLEVDERELHCLGYGETLYHGSRHELEYYYGVELLVELDRLQKSLGS